MSKKKPLVIQIPLFPREKGRWSSRPTSMEQICEEGERREWQSGRGRKLGSGKVSPSYIIGRVEHLIETGEARNIHEAFYEVSHETGYEMDTVKKIYYTALKRDRYRPLIEWTNEPKNEEKVNLKSLEKLINDGGWLSRDYLIRELGKEKTEEILSRYGEKLKENFEKLTHKSSETQERDESEGDEENAIIPKDLWNILTKLDPKKDREEIESYCTLRNLDLEAVIEQIMVEQNKE